MSLWQASLNSFPWRLCRAQEGAQKCARPLKVLPHHWLYVASATLFDKASPKARNCKLARVTKSKDRRRRRITVILQPNEGARDERGYWEYRGEENRHDPCLLRVYSLYIPKTCATGGNADLQLQDNGCTMVVYLWDLNVDLINWSLAPETGDSACPTWDLLTRLIVSRTNYWNWILTKSYSVTSLQSANPIEQRTTTTLTKSYVLLRWSHWLICSLPHTPYCTWCPWTRIICPEGDLRHCGFLLKNGFQPTCGKLRARRPSQGLLVVHLPDVKAQRQKVIVSKWPHPLAP